MQVRHMGSVLTINHFLKESTYRKISVDGNFTLAEIGSPKLECLVCGENSGLPDFTFRTFVTGEPDLLVGEGSTNVMYFRPITEEAKTFVEECR